MDYKSLAKKIFDITGPEENILQASHCMTRLRLQLRHATPEMQIQLQSLEGVLGINATDDDLQIILGPGAAGQTTAALQALVQTAGAGQAAQTNPINQPSRNNRENTRNTEAANNMENAESSTKQTGEKK